MGIMSGHGLGVFVICPLEACTGSFVCMSGAGTMQNHNMSLQSGHRRLGPNTFFHVWVLFMLLFIFFVLGVPLFSLVLLFRVVVQLTPFNLRGDYIIIIV